MSDKLVRIKNRYDTAENWGTENPILAAGEIGIDSTNNIIKVGNGTDCWFNLRSINRENIFFPYILKNMDSTIEIQLPGYFYTSISKDNPDTFGPPIVSVSNLKMALFIQGCLPVIYEFKSGDVHLVDVISATDSNADPITTINAYINIVANPIDGLCASMLTISVTTKWIDSGIPPLNPLDGRSAVLFISDNSEFKI